MLYQIIPSFLQCFYSSSPKIERILVLLRMCLKVNIYCFASGSAILSLVLISASNFDSLFYKKSISQQTFIITILITNNGNLGEIAGIHNTKAAQEFQTLGKYVLKAPVYRPTKFIDKTSEVFTSKSNELVVYPRTAHLSHYCFENVQSRFVATSASKWDIHTFSFASADRAFKVLAESDRGPVVIEYGSYCLGTYFDISICSLSQKTFKYRIVIDQHQVLQSMIIQYLNTVVLLLINLLSNIRQTGIFDITKNRQQEISFCSIIKKGRKINCDLPNY